MLYVGFFANSSIGEAELLVHFLSKLESFGIKSNPDTTEEDGMRHLCLLIKHLEKAYESKLAK